MTKKRQTIVTDTGDVAYLPTDKGKMAYVITWPSDAGPPRGRPAEKDWVSMLRWLVVKVSREGLPQEHGGQATVERWVQQWLLDRNLDASESLIRDHVHQIYAEAEKGR
jgi:hypothetical protein